MESSHLLQVTLLKKPSQWEGMDHVTCLGCLWEQHLGQEKSLNSRLGWDHIVYNQCQAVEKIPGLYQKMFQNSCVPWGGGIGYFYILLHKEQKRLSIPCWQSSSSAFPVYGNVLLPNVGMDESKIVEKAICSWVLLILTHGISNDGFPRAKVTQTLSTFSHQKKQLIILLRTAHTEELHLMGRI